MNIEVTDVERLTLRPGDALVIRIPHKIWSDHQAHLIIRRVRGVLGLDESVPVLILEDGASVEVIEAMESPG